MMKSVLKFVAWTVIVLASLSIFGWNVKRVIRGNSNLPKSIKKNITALVEFPDVLFQITNEFRKQYPTFRKTPGDFEPINKLTDDVKILTSYHNANDTRTVALINLRTGEELKTWTIEKLSNVNDRIRHSIMLEDSSLVYSLNWYSGLHRIDKDGNLMWEQQQFYHHHAMNLDKEGIIWANTFDKEIEGELNFSGTFTVGEDEYNFLDNGIAAVDPNSGEILYEVSILDILQRHNMEYLLLKAGGPKDPIHINDVEPAYYSSPYFNKGDIFISARNGSWIIQYRPETEEVIRLIEGPFFAQHDVDIESDSTIIFFNNNAQEQKKGKAVQWSMAKDPVSLEPFMSNIMRYNLRTGEFSTVENDLFIEHDIFTFTEGIVDTVAGGGYFVEEQNSSVLWILKDGEVLYKDVLPSHRKGWHHLANWARVIY